MKDLNQSEFNEEIKEGITVVDFWAPWCGPCRMFAPIFEQTAAELTDVSFAKVNADENQELMAEEGIRSIPTIKFYKDGVCITDATQIGPLSKEDFIKKINSL